MNWLNAYRDILEQKKRERERQYFERVERLEAALSLKLEPLSTKVFFENEGVKVVVVDKEKNLGYTERIDKTTLLLMSHTDIVERLSWKIKKDYTEAVQMAPERI